MEKWLQGPEYAKKKVSLDSDGYLEDRDVARVFAGERESRIKSGCFGAAELSHIAVEEHLAEIRATQDPEEQKRIKDDLNKSRKKILTETRAVFANYAPRRKYQWQMRAFAAEALAVPEIEQEIQALTAKHKPESMLSSEEKLLRTIFGETREPSPTEAFVRLVEKKKVPLPLWRKILENHRDNFAEATDLFDEETAEQLRNSFKELAIKNIEEGYLPISHERVDHVYSKLSIGIRDGLLSSFKDAAGTYSSKDEEVLLASYLLSGKDDHLVKTYTHEMMHALAGKTVLEITPEDESESEDTFAHYAHAREGFLFRGQGIGVFYWLNEALTEKMTMDMLETESQTYEAERMILEYLMTKGSKPIPLKMFQEAYFEDYEPGIEPTIPKGERFEM